MSNGYIKEYIAGSARTKTFDNGGNVINVSIKESELAKLPRTKSKSGDAYVAFSLSSKREEDEYGNSHAIQISYKEEDAPTKNSESNKSDDEWS